MSTLVSVVVPTYKRPELLERCLKALIAQSFPADAFEIVVADDGPDEATRRLVREWALRTCGAPEIRYVTASITQGPAGARNRGWEAADSPIIAFTDDDAVPEPGWLVEGYQVILASPKYLAATGRIVMAQAREGARREGGKVDSPPDFATANCFVRRSALEAIGGFDERFTSAGREDSDLQFTLMKSLPGEIVKAPRAIVERPPRAMTWADGLRAHRRILFDALLFKKHPELYRERIGRAPPWSHYVIVAAIFGMILGLVAGSDPAIAICFATWLVLTTRVTLKRLYGITSKRGRVIDVVLASMAIPPFAVFWRLMGALRFRVLFL